MNQSWSSTSRQGRRSPGHRSRLPPFRRPTFPGETCVPASDDEITSQFPAWAGGIIPQAGTSMELLASVRIHHWTICDGPVISSGRLAQGCVSLSNNRPWMDQSIASDDDEHSPRPSHYSGKPCLWYLGLRSAWLPSCPLTHSQNPITSHVTKPRPPRPRCQSYFRRDQTWRPSTAINKQGSK